MREGNSLSTNNEGFNKINYLTTINIQEHIEPTTKLGGETFYTTVATLFYFKAPIKMETRLENMQRIKKIWFTKK